MLPTTGLMDHWALTAPPPPIPPEPPEAENCWVSEAVSETCVGNTLIEDETLGVKEIVACADCVGSARLVAVKLTV